MRFPPLFLCFFLISQVSFAWDEFPVIENAVFSDDIKTPQAYPRGNPLGYPFLFKGTSDQLDFHFDEMGSDRETYRYAAIHCDHDWRVSDIESMEYIEGFSFQEINQVDYAFNTISDYVHYKFIFPNDMMKPKISGNYGIVVFTGMDVQDKDSWLLSYRIMIFEDKVSVPGEIITSSLVSKRYSSQQINFDLIPGTYSIMDPTRDIHVSILQNGNWASAINGLKPIFIKPTSLTFNYTNGENNFDGGSEYRNFEMKDLRYNSMNVEAIVQQDDGWHAYLRPDKSMAGKSYRSDIDINGKYFIRNDRAGNSDLEAEYVWTHFVLVMPEISESEVIIEGGFTAYSTEHVVCKYDHSLNAYTAVVPLKQGLYNYRYIVEDKYHPGGDLSLIEGNYYQTENEYHILVYHYDRNLGCDRLVGMRRLSSSR